MPASRVAYELQLPSYLYMVNQREYLLEPVERLMKDIVAKISRAIPIAYQKAKPQNENRLNDTIQSILASENESFEREYPSIALALCKTVPDQSWGNHRLLLETKYLRKKISLANLTDQIGADLLKYPRDNKILFVLYDPYRSIYDDVKFSSDVQGKDPRFVVEIVR